MNEQPARQTGVPTELRDTTYGAAYSPSGPSPTSSSAPTATLTYESLALEALRETEMRLIPLLHLYRGEKLNRAIDCLREEMSLKHMAALVQVCRFPDKTIIRVTHFIPPTGRVCAFHEYPRGRAALLKALCEKTLDIGKCS